MLPPGAGAGFDVTSLATIPADAVAVESSWPGATGSLAGLSVAAYAVAVVCEPAGEFEITPATGDGAAVRPGDVLATVVGNARALLTAERSHSTC